MGAIDDALKANERYSRGFEHGHLTMPPARKLAVLACMDARLDVLRILGLQPGDAHVIRNAGGIATEDAVRSLVISQQLLGTQEIMLIHHTDCGMLTFRDEELHRKLRSSTGTSAIVPAVFYAFSGLEEDVREQMRRLRSHPWIPKSIPIRGFVYDVKTGTLREVSVREVARSAG